MLRTWMEVVPVIVTGLVLAAVVAAALGAVVGGVRRTDRHKRLSDSSHHGHADAFARKVLGVYARQPLRRGADEDVTADRWNTGRR